MTRTISDSRSGRILSPFSSLAQLNHTTKALRCVVALLLAFGSFGLIAQSPVTPATTKPPVLTDVQKLTLQNLAQRIEIAQLKAQAAQQEFDLARAAFVSFVQPLRVEGFDLNVQTGEYIQKPEPKPPGKIE